MKKLLIISFFLIMAVPYFLGDAFSCGMMMRGMMSGMPHHHRMKTNGEETYRAMSHDHTAIEEEESDVAIEPARLVQSRCSQCHSLRYIALSRKGDWSRTVYRMNGHLMSRNMPSLTDEEKGIIIGYLNSHYRTAY